MTELDRVTDPLDRLELGLEGDLLIPLRETMSAGVNTRASIIQLHPPADDCVYCLTGPAIGYGTAPGQEAIEDTADALACDGDSDSPACRDLGFRPQFTVGLRWRWDTQDTPLHHQLALVARLVRQHRLAGHVADGENALVRGPPPLIDLEEALLIDLDLSVL